MHLGKSAFIFGTCSIATICIFFIYSENKDLPQLAKPNYKFFHKLLTIAREQTEGSLISFNHIFNGAFGNDSEKQIPESKLILLYTPVFDRFPWNIRYMGNISQCPLTNCRLTYNRSLFSESDLVVFHGRDLPGVQAMTLLHARRPPNQRWCFLVYESQVNTPNLSPYDGMFNWTTSFREKSDPFWPYNYYLELKEKKNLKGINFAENKTKMVSIVYSHCVPYRTKIVKALLDLKISIDAYGSCYGNRKRICGWNCPDFFQDYKFYLSVENSYCPDYITEKYWNALRHNMVPIVLGGANYSNPKLAIPGSFINALDFKSIKGLADYIKYLDGNDTAYNQYFRWKENYYIGLPMDKSPVCIWCKLLSDPNTPSKIYKPINEFWSASLCQNINSVVDTRLFLPTT